MTEREIIILSASVMGKCFHLSGIERDSDRWIRICSKYTRSHGAIPFDQLIYEDFTPVRLFDVVRLRLERHEPYFEQPERYRYDASYRWKRLDHVTLPDVIALHGFDEREYVFCNRRRWLWKTELARSEERESLLLMYVTNLNVNVITVRLQKKISLQFEYAGKNYEGFSIGDIRVRNYYMQQPLGVHHFADEAAVVFSLSVRYLDGKYYKSAAQILRWN